VVRARTRLIFWALVLTTSGALVVALGEAAARFREARRSYAPTAMSTAFYIHRRLGPMLRRNASYYGWHHIDSLGLRGPDVALQKSPGTIRIVTDGGSTTFDTMVSGDDSTWSSQLQRILRGREVPVEVLNAGVPGHRVVDNLIRVQTETHRLAPDVVVQMQGHNDLFAALFEFRYVEATDTPGAIRPMTPWGNWLARHSVLYGQLVARVRAVRRRARGREKPAGALRELPFDSALVLGEQRFEHDLTAYVLVTRASGARVVLMEPAHISGADSTRYPVAASSYANAFPGVPVEVTLEGYRRFRDVVRRVAARTGADLIRTGALGMDEPAFYEVGDPMHLNDAGARHLAEGVSEALVRQGIVPATSR